MKEIVKLHEDLLNKTIKAPLQRHFSKKLSFWAASGKSDLVTNEKPLLILTQSFFDAAYNQNPSTEIIKAAKIVRHEILEDPKPFSQWSPTPEEVADGTVDLLDFLTSFLVHFLRYKLWILLDKVYFIITLPKNQDKESYTAWNSYQKKYW